MFLCEKSPLKLVVIRLSIRIFMEMDNVTDILKLLYI